MKSYIIHPTSVKISDIQLQGYIFSPTRHRKVLSKNSSMIPLESIIEDSKLSMNIRNNKGMYNYIEIGDINIHTGGVIEKSRRSIDISSDSVYKIKESDIVVSTVRTYLGGIGYISSSNDNLVASKALIVLRKLKINISRYYLFGVMRSSFFIDQASLLLNSGVYPRMERIYFKDLFIPFPTIKNHPHPEQVESYISLLVQNMIDKEEQIRIRNDRIDGLIEVELQENQKQKIFTYTIPKVSDLKMEGRLDAGYYGEKYKKEDSYFEYYTGGYSDIFSLGYEISRGQNLQVSNIGESWYFDEYKKGSYKLLLSKYFGSRTIERFSYIGNKCELKTIKKGDIIFSCRGEMGRAYYFPEEIENTITNIDNVHIIATSRNIEEKTYLFCMLGFLKKKGILDSIACTGSGAPSFTKYQFEKLKVPNFPDSKQQEIAKLYYHPIPKNTELTLENYLIREKSRNSEIGIFQLNMEIFALREKLEETIDRIVMEEEIEICL